MLCIPRCNRQANYSVCRNYSVRRDQFFIAAGIQSIWLRIRLAAARLAEPHGWNEDERSLRRGFKGGVAGGVPPHKGGPKARPPIKLGLGERSEESENTFACLVQSCKSIAAEYLPLAIVV